MNRGLALMAALATLVGVLCSIPLPLLTRYVIDDVIVARDLGGLPQLLAIFFVLLLLASLGSFAGRVGFIRLQQGIVRDIQEELVRRIVSFPIEFFSQRQTGYLMSRVRRDTLFLQGLFGAAIPETGVAMMKLVGGVVMLVVLSGRLTVVALGLLPLYLLFAGRLAGRVRLESRVSMEAAGVLSQRLKDLFGSVALVRVYGREQEEISSVRDALDLTVEAETRQRTITLMGASSLALLGGVGTLAIAYFGTREVMAGRMTVGDFVAFNSYVVFLYVPVSMAANVHLMLQPVLVAAGRIGELLSGVPEEPQGGARVESLRVPIAFSNVTFGYEDDGRPCLRDFTLRIRPGERIVFVGESGAGKSSAVSLLLGLRTPTSGSITVGDRPLSELSLRDMRARIAVVLQDAFLFSGTVRENVAAGCPGVAEVEVTRVLSQVGMDARVAGLPEGLDTQVGEGGGRLSVGERQRLALARALVRGADLLVLDEATSALDPAHEAAFLDTLGRLDLAPTILVVSHRATVAEWCDRVAFFGAEGRVTVGTHRSLLRDNPEYAAFWRDVPVHGSLPPAPGMEAAAFASIGFPAGS